MAKNDFSHEESKNAADKCLCVLCLDVSGSMYGIPIDELNKGLQQFQEEILDDPVATSKLEVAIITFGGKVTQVQSPAMLTDFTMPNLETTGTTPMIAAIEEAIQLTEDRKAWYKSKGLGYYRPWVILMTDGEPDEVGGVAAMAQKLRTLEASKSLVFSAIGVGDDVNMTTLRELAPKAAMLKGMSFSGFFQWLSNSITAISASKPGETVQTENPSGWGTFQF